MPTQERPLLAGDHRAWPRPEAMTLKDRTVEHQPTAISGNKPIAVGYGFSTIVWIPQTQGSWALPLRHERSTSFETPLTKAAFAPQTGLLPPPCAADSSLRSVNMIMLSL